MLVYIRDSELRNILIPVTKYDIPSEVGALLRSFADRNFPFAYLEFH